MKNIRIILFNLAATGFLIAGFQNCGGKQFSGDQSSGSSAQGTGTAGVAGVSGSGNMLTNALGQQLSFVNNTGVAIGNVSFSSPGTRTQIPVDLFNPLSGRLSKVTVLLDPNTGAFLSVSAATPQPYMCHDPSANPCVNYPNLLSGGAEPNCNSPINFTGALNGSVNSLVDTAYTRFCASPTPTNAGLCQFVLSGGGSASTANSSLNDCQSECRTNANLNPRDTLTCYYSGAVISF